MRSSRYTSTFRSLALLSTSPRRSISKRSWTLDAVYRTLLELGQSDVLQITEHQAMAVKMATLGYSVFLHLPTGSGKSLAFQSPALLAERHQTTLVVSPLIALINDQVAALKRKGIEALQVSGGQKTKHESLTQMLDGKQLVYTTPEYLQLNAEMREWVSVAAREDRLARIVLDEAHCVLEWGNAFRPSYLQLCRWKQQFMSNVPITLVTASVSDDDIARLAEMFQLQVVTSLPVKFDPIASKHNQMVVIQQLTDRTNLRIEIIRKPSQADQWIATRVKNEPTIVYCMTRREADETCLALVQLGCHAGVYHGGVSQKRREFVRKQWMMGQLTIMCATSAFGMGIDRSDVRFVIHRSMPVSLSAYWQQIGRSGRDGRPSVCVLLYSENDKNRANILTTDIHELNSTNFGIFSTGSSRGEVEAISAYCEMETGCRKELLFSHFGFCFDSSRCVRNCNCGLPLDQELCDRENLWEGSSKLKHTSAPDGFSHGTIEYQYQKVLAKSRRLKLSKREALSRRLIRNILEIKPKSEEEMASMRGIGAAKASRYFSLFCFD
ncbi:atp-dependent dna [Plasmopara halstedii]|uniref:DNA 3'-5' helicase n=1 Tax=Plasmopara halstedii TaxID=4781 RepID=A0A0P1B2P2_PLAHL|nr:atp-dependent dna [Plasmopara halstedii]CEG49018.1 atp-dependent dna [Plasmopara halstedii]|eukprot:XP_024585387.1 atp-dependent dna [Plasmopara halstedii]